jgi:hypothetical protein
MSHQHDGHCHEIKRERGLFQGSLLSPFLFNIFIDPLAEELQKESDKIEDESVHNTQDYNQIRLPPIQKDNLWECQMCGSLATSRGGITRHMNNKQTCSQNKATIREARKEISSKYPRFLFYADDIEINGKNTQEVQRLLTVIEKWCKENHMTPGLKKCQWVGPPEVTQPLYLNETELEKVESYRYLGVPMTYQGIDFTKYMESKIQSTEKKFWYLHSHGQYLPPAHRLYLIKSEVLSMLEYTLPLYGHIMNTPHPQKQDLKRLKNQISIIIDRARSWAGQINRGKELACHLTNIHSIKDVLEERISGLNYRLENLPQEHPLLKIRHLESTIPEEIKTKSLIFKCFESNIVKEFKVAKQNPANSKLTLKQFTKNKKTQEMAEKSPLVCYTMIPKKNARSSTDITYRIKNKTIRNNAIKWRKNQVGYVHPAYTKDNYQTVKDCVCRHCNVKFTRSHVNVCPLITQDPTIPRKHWNLFLKNKERIALRFPHANSYTILDHLINCFQITTFQHIFAKICEQLEYQVFLENIESVSIPSSNRQNEGQTTNNYLNNSTRLRDSDSSLTIRVNRHGMTTRSRTQAVPMDPAPSNRHPL